MTTSGDVGTEIAPEVADDPELAARLGDLLHRACSLARALTDAEQAALSVDLDGDGHAARKFFNLSAQYSRPRDFRGRPARLRIARHPAPARRGGASDAGRGRGHAAWGGFGGVADTHPPLRGWLATPDCGEDGWRYGLLQLSDKSGGLDFTAEYEARIPELAAFTCATLGALRAARSPE